MSKLTRIEDWVAIIRVAIGMQRILLIADDVWQIKVAQIFQLGGPNCAYLITTRLPDVAVRFADGGAVEIHELDEDDGLRLLVRLAPEVVKSEPDEARRLTRIVGNLPLALILMGNYLQEKTHSGQPRRIWQALQQLYDTEKRLQLDDDQIPGQLHPSLPSNAPITINSIIAVSDEALDEVSRSALRALSTFPSKPNTFSEAAAVAVAAAPAETLDTLTDYGLLETAGPARYTLHQTIADYARLKLADTAAYERMVEFFISFIETHQTDYDTLDLETNNVLAALDIAFNKKMQPALVRGANTFYPFLETRGLYDLAQKYLSQAQQLAKSINDLVGFITTLLNLGRIAENRGDYKQAEEYWQEGLALARKINHIERTSALLQNLGSLTIKSGNYVRAEEYLVEGVFVNII
jgi:tetratricopeptide (TPR) repeat protein